MVYLLEADVGKGILFAFLSVVAASLVVVGALRILVRPGRVIPPCGRSDPPRTVTLSELRRGDAVGICSCSIKTCIIAIDPASDEQSPDVEPEKSHPRR